MRAAESGGEADADHDRDDSRLRARSATVRPPSTAILAIGRVRKRTRMPVRRSPDRPTAVPTAPKATVCAKMPGIRKST